MPVKKLKIKRFLHRVGYSSFYVRFAIFKLNSEKNSENELNVGPEIKRTQANKWEKKMEEVGTENKR